MYGRDDVTAEAKMGETQSHIPLSSQNFIKQLCHTSLENQDVHVFRPRIMYNLDLSQSLKKSLFPIDGLLKFHVNEMVGRILSKLYNSWPLWYSKL